MRRRLPRLKSPPAWLRLVLAVLLVLNGAIAPLGSAHAVARAHAPMATPDATQDATTQATHCHDHTAAQTTAANHSSHVRLSCCDGVECQCHCASVVALAALFPDLRPLAPQLFSGDDAVPQATVPPPALLFRPPIA